MARLFPGILIAIVVGLPGFWIGSLIAAPRVRERPILEIASTFVTAIPLYFVMFGLPTLLYGSLIWWLLRLLGQLNIVALLLAATIPVLAYFTWGIFRHGWDPRLLLAVWAFWLPAIFIAVWLWWFTIHAVVSEA